MKEFSLEYFKIHSFPGSLQTSGIKGDGTSASARFGAYESGLFIQLTIKVYVVYKERILPFM